MTLNYQAIAHIHAIYKEKFAVPRQPGLVEASAKITFASWVNAADAVHGLAQFSHIWLIFDFHQTPANQWSPKVRPPRLGGNQKIGVFATRSPFRPNHIGLSVVELLAVDIQKNDVTLTVKGADLVDGTPILDIKPYLPYADAIADANGSYATDEPDAPLYVRFNDSTLATLITYQHEYPDLRQIIEQTLAQDPRPAYKKKQADDKVYGVKLYDFDVHFSVNGHCCHVVSITPIVDH